VALAKQDWSSLADFGASVRRERVARGLTQEKLAELAGLHIRSLQKIEAGEINLLLTTVIRLKGALECPWVKLLG
jgi:transcriptional regulator with XRE-family HTH domain